jgi:Ca2+/Na+ antiporter
MLGKAIVVATIYILPLLICFYINVWFGLVVLALYTLYVFFISKSSNEYVQKFTDYNVRYILKIYELINKIWK